MKKGYNTMTLYIAQNPVTLRRPFNDNSFSDGSDEWVRTASTFTPTCTVE